MNNKVYIAIVLAITAVILGALFLYSGTEVKGGEVHKCATSTNINDLFCKEK